MLSELYSWFFRLYQSCTPLNVLIVIFFPLTNQLAGRANFKLEEDSFRFLNSIEYSGKDLFTQASKQTADCDL